MIEIPHYHLDGLNNAIGSLQNTLEAVDGKLLTFLIHLSDL